MINRSFFACGVECVRCNSVGYVGARRAMTAARWGAGEVCCLVKGCAVFLVKENFWNCCVCECPRNKVVALVKWMFESHVFLLPYCGKIFAHSFKYRHECVSVNRLYSCQFRNFLNDFLFVTERICCHIFCKVVKSSRPNSKGQKTVSESVRTRHPNYTNSFGDWFVEPLSKQYSL